MTIRHHCPSCNDGLPLFAWAHVRPARVDAYAVKVIARKFDLPPGRARLFCELARIGIWEAR